MMLNGKTFHEKSDSVGKQFPPNPRNSAICINKGIEFPYLWRGRIKVILKTIRRITPNKIPPVSQEYPRRQQNASPSQTTVGFTSDLPWLQ